MPSYEIKTYTPDKRSEIELFRELSFKEGNDSISYEKYDPDFELSQNRVKELKKDVYKK